MPLSPMERYQLDVKERGLVHDDAQYQAVVSLQLLYEELTVSAPIEEPASGLLSFFKSKPKKKASAKGVYLWGGVGRGKTFLIDSFFSCLPFKEKRRVHFQRFMKEVHETLKGLPKSPDPLPIVAQQFADQAKLICLDEFHVDDVADAMLLAGLLESMMNLGVVLVFTSNIEPDELYLNGLQRQRFLPAIELIKLHNMVIHLDSPTDYRKGLSTARNGFFSPHTPEVEEIFHQIIKRDGSEVTRAENIVINQRDVKTEAYSDVAIWVSFHEICATAKSYYDYLVIAERFQVIILSKIPEMRSGSDDVANRFIQLVDALYDHGNVLIASANVPLPQLYTGQGLAFPFQRTRSRLEEMFSERYRNGSGQL